MSTLTMPETARADMDAHRAEIEAALGYNGETHTFTDVVMMVVSGEAQFWPAPRSCMVTELVDYPQRRTLHVFLAAGNLHELEIMLPTILHWAVAQGCTSATFIGRKGWERTFIRAHGWAPSLVLFSKDLTELDAEPR